MAERARIFRVEKVCIQTATITHDADEIFRDKEKNLHVMSVQVGK
jgi:hypothetical protein